jgi:CPA2 family monovalent cation:H+ antiporter-2
MHEAHEFLRSLAVVLGVAAVTTVVFQRLHQPVVLGYLIAGLIIGPHVPIPLVADPRVVQTLSELGVILLMFSLGLEFSFSKLLRVGPTAGVTAAVQCSLMIWLGFLTGRAFGWTTFESVFAGAVIAISSTTIIAKAFDEQKVGGRLREIVVGVLVVEDVIAILLMASLTTAAARHGLSAGEVFSNAGKLVAFLVALVVVGLLVVPRGMRAVVRLGRAETTLVASVGLCFAVALLAQEFGYSVALGAFLAGSLVAESGEEHAVAHLVEPVRDMFAAVFFVSVGMLIDPALVARHWAAIAVFTVVVVVGKVASVSFGAFLTGNGTRTSIQAGMSVAQIGEFSFIIAGLGVSMAATREFLYPVAVAVSALTTLTTPWLIRASGPVANWVDRKSPKALQTFAALYGSWLESLRNAPAQKTTRMVVRRLVRLLLADAALLATVVAVTAAWFDEATAFVADSVGVSRSAAPAVVVAAAAALCVPFALGAVRVARKLGATLAAAAFPAADGKHLDLAAAPRRALVVTVQLAATLLVGAPVVVLAEPFVPPWIAVAAVASILAVLGFVFWRTAADLQGHVRAGAQVIVEALAAQSRGTRNHAATPTLDPVHALLPGLGEPVPVRLDAASPAVGRTLAELNLRGVTGATVLAITRGDEGAGIAPAAQERLRAGDVLAIAGAHDAVERARALLEVVRPDEAPPPA